MEEAVEKIASAMGTRMLWLAVLMLALSVCPFALILSPAFDWMRGLLGRRHRYHVRFMPAMAALVLRNVLENIKQRERLGDL